MTVHSHLPLPHSVPTSSSGWSGSTPFSLKVEAAPSASQRMTPAHRDRPPQELTSRRSRATLRKGRQRPQQATVKGAVVMWLALIGLWAASETKRVLRSCGWGRHYSVRARTPAVSPSVVQRVFYVHCKVVTPLRCGVAVAQVCVLCCLAQPMHVCTCATIRPTRQASWSSYVSALRSSWAATSSSRPPPLVESLPRRPSDVRRDGTGIGRTRPYGVRVGIGWWEDRAETGLEDGTGWARSGRADIRQVRIGWGGVASGAAPCSA